MIYMTPLLLTGVGIASKILQGSDPSFAEAITIVSAGVAPHGIRLPVGTLPLAPAKGVAAEGLQHGVTDTVKTDPLLQAHLDKYSGANRKEQIANGEKYTTLNSEVVSDQTVALQGGERRTILIDQQVVEQSYLDHGNLMDFVATIKAGQAPTLDAAFLALVDCVDAMTLNMLRPLLLHWKVDSHVMCRTVEVRLDDQIRDSAENAPQTVDKQVSKKVEEKFGPDKIFETATTRTVDTKVLSHIEGKQLTTTTYAPRPQAENASPTYVVDKVERESLVAVQENITTSKIDKSIQTESMQIFGWDVGSVISKKVTPGQETQSLDATSKLRIYHSKDAGDFSEALADGKLTDVEARGLKLELVDDKRTDAPTQFSVLSDGGPAQLDPGLIEWVPLGSLVTMGAKSSYGMDITTSDVFWGAVDVALTVGTLGTAAVIANSAKTVGVQAVKGIAKGAVRETVEVVAKEGGKVGRAVFNDIKEFTPNIFKHPGKLSLQSSEKVTQGGVKHLVKDELAHGAKAGSHGAENAAKAIGESLTSLKPNSAITKNGYEFTTDALGRVNSAKGQLRLEKVPHDPFKQRAAAEMGYVGDHGGHLIGAQFSGPSELLNLVPQNGVLNLGEWKKMEMGWKKALEAGKTVKVNIQPLYKGTSLRPNKFVAEYWVDGAKEMRVFTNHLPKV